MIIMNQRNFLPRITKIYDNNIENNMKNLFADVIPGGWFEKKNEKFNNVL